MGVRSLSVAVLLLASATVEAQAQRPAIRYNNPTVQNGMYNVQSGPIRFNNPTNQVGMYAANPVLQYNNPLNQVGMYSGANFNNPLYQGNYVPGGFNNPLTQGNYVPNGYNNPLAGGWGSYGYNNPLVQGNMYSGANANNPLMPNNLNPTGQGLNSTAPKVNPQASATLNGLNKPATRNAKASGSASRKSTKRKK